MSNKFKYSKEYRNREKVKCSYCPGSGRDVHVVENTKGFKLPMCKNCQSKLLY